MTTLRIIVAATLLLAWGTSASANPIPTSSFSELLFTGAGWVLEIHANYSNLDGWSLRSNSGSAFFKNGIQLGSSRYVLITQDSLLGQLGMNPLGDSLVLVSPQGYRESLKFGSAPYSQIAKPETGQSICWNQAEPYCYYLDNSPTPGLPNDSSNAMGTLHGVVTDSLGQPLSNVSVWRSYEHPSTFTNSSGQFTITDYACLASMRLERAGFVTTYCAVQLRPESTVTTTFVMRSVTAVDGGSTDPGGYLLYQNHPNPFNPTTIFSFTLPRSSFVTLRVYDIHGREVATVVNEARNQGTNEAQWDASHVASGVYFYRLIAGDFVQTRKMVLTR